VIYANEVSGWTLQELLAPSTVIFFSTTWTSIGCRNSKIASEKPLTDRIAIATRIPHNALNHFEPKDHSIAQRMSWAARRRTTRSEDMAYCLLGIFGVNMPLIYGEGASAFKRLQAEIISISDDHSIFAWDHTKANSTSFSGLLASDVSLFRDCHNILRTATRGHNRAYELTNKGLKISLNLVRMNPSPGTPTIYALLDCQRSSDLSTQLAILINEPWTHEDDIFNVSSSNPAINPSDNAEIYNIFRVGGLYTFSIDWLAYSPVFRRTLYVPEDTSQRSTTFRDGCFFLRDVPSNYGYRLAAIWPEQQFGSSDSVLDAFQSEQQRHLAVLLNSSRSPNVVLLLHVETSDSGETFKMEVLPADQLRETVSGSKFLGNPFTGKVAKRFAKGLPNHQSISYRFTTDDDTPVIYAHGQRSVRFDEKGVEHWMYVVSVRYFPDLNTHTNAHRSL
jgi:hypothetical protein